MTWARRLLNLPQQRGVDQLAAWMVPLYRELLERVDSLSRTAELAPHAAAETDLRHLAAAEQELAERLAAVLRERQVVLTPLRSVPPETNGPSHWTRLVHELERLRAVRAALLDASMRVATDDETLSSLLRELMRETDSCLRQLRMLIARADPQALD